MCDGIAIIRPGSHYVRTEFPPYFQVPAFPSRCRGAELRLSDGISRQGFSVVVVLCRAARDCLANARFPDQPFGQSAADSTKEPILIDAARCPNDNNAQRTDFAKSRGRPGTIIGQSLHECPVYASHKRNRAFQLLSFSGYSRLARWSNVDHCPLERRLSIS